MKAATTTVSTKGPRARVSRHFESEESDYQGLVKNIRSVSALNPCPLFTTDATGLYDLFLAEIPASRRQYYVCRTCRKFVERFGGLVTVNDEGHAVPLFWSDAPKFFREAVSALESAVSGARVTGVFLSSENTWGLPSNTANKTGVEWHHLHLHPSVAMRRVASVIKSDEQAIAEKLEDRGILSRGLAEFPIELVRQAYTLLTTGGLYRSEKCIGVAKWLLDLQESLAGVKHKARRENLVWRAVATAPPGFCHIRSTMISTLLTDLAEGKSFDAIKASFDTKMSPIEYQRPKTAPTDGQLAAAETLVEKLASAGSLTRRYATLEEILPHAIWTPKRPKTPPGNGVFDHLRTDRRDAPETLDVNRAQTITWDKFNWTVLPNVERMELLAPYGNSSFFAFVTAEDPDAPPILQWDRDDVRNPVSWYLYHGGSQPSHWNLAAGEFHEVVAIAPQPSSWNEGKVEHQGDGAYFILRGARDVHKNAGLGLFPEILRSEYREIRTAIEAFSRKGKLSGADTASACGIALQKGGTKWDQIVRVTVSGVRVLYRLDRWD